MFDIVATSIDGILFLAALIAGIVFFLFGPHKVYESLFAALIAIGLYLFIYVATFVIPEVTTTVPGGAWMIRERGVLLLWSNIMMVILFFLAPISIGLNVGGVIRGSFWFFLKLITLSVFFVMFGVVISGFVTAGGAIFGQSPLWNSAYATTPFFLNAPVYTWIIRHSYILLLTAFLLGLYKIVFSHWIGTWLLLIGSLVYVKGGQIFGRKSFDQHTEVVHEEHEEEEVHHH